MTNRELRLRRRIDQLTDERDRALEERDDLRRAIKKRVDPELVLERDALRRQLAHARSEILSLRAKLTRRQRREAAA